MDEEITTLLLDCLHQDAGRVTLQRVSSLTSEEWERFLTLAERQRVPGALYQRLKSRGLDSPIPDGILRALRQRYHNTATDNLRLYAELHRLVSALHAQKIPVLALKGIYVATVLYETLGSREMGDIDVMVPVARLGQAAEIVKSLGYEPMLPYWIDAAGRWSNLRHLPRFLKPGVAAVELHWNITDSECNPSIDPGELWARVVPTALTGVEALGLGPEDLVLHLCIHASYQHLFEFGLRPFCDIGEAARHFGETLAWPHVMERARRWNCQRGVYLALRLAKELLGAAVPDEVLRETRPAAFDDAMIAVARTQILTVRSPGSDVTPMLVRWWHAEGLIGKVRLFLQRVLVCRAELSQMYGVPPNSWRVYFWYPVRLKDVLWRHGRKALDLALGVLRGDPLLTAIVERKWALEQWLREG